MVPWAKHDKIVIALIVLLERCVGRQGTIEILLVPPPANHERSYVCRLQIISGAPCLPIIVVAWVRNKGIPRGKFSSVQFRDFAECALFQIPVVGVLVEIDVLNLFRTFYRFYVFVSVA